jgi:hypothetical protein
MALSDSVHKRSDPSFLRSLLRLFVQASNFVPLYDLTVLNMPSVDPSSHFEPCARSLDYNSETYLLVESFLYYL